MRKRICPSCNSVGIGQFKQVTVLTVVRFRDKDVEIDAKVLECRKCKHQVSESPYVYDATAEVYKKYHEMTKT